MSVTLMGAMYSPVDREVSTAKLLLDLAELYIHSMEDLTDEFEIRQMLRLSAATSPDSIKLGPLAFQYLQAAYLMVCVQFWAGSMVSRKRAIETRFGVVVKVLSITDPFQNPIDKYNQIARKLRLHKAKHELEDSLDESTWIQKETQIRYTPLISPSLPFRQHR